MTSEEIKNLNDFIRTAGTESIEKAIESFGEGIDDREINTLRTLSQSELLTLHELNTKISDAANADLAADWTCGAVC